MSMEWISNILDALNHCAGLFSLLALLAAVIIPIVIYRRGRKNTMSDLQDELDSINSNTFNGLPSDMRDFFIRKNTLERKLKK